MNRHQVEEPDRRVLMRRAWLLCAGVLALLAVPAALAAWHWPVLRTPLLVAAIWCTLFGLSLPVLVVYAMRRPLTTAEGLPSPGPWVDAQRPQEIDLDQTRTYRLSLLGRLTMMANWPVFFLGIVQTTVVVLLFSWGPVTSAAAVPVLAVQLWGWSRCWQLRVTLGPDRLEILNPLRTYRFPMDPALEFAPDLTDITHPALPCISLTREERRIRIIATTSLPASSRSVLAWHLQRLSRRTGCRSTVPPTWPTAAPGQPRRR